MKNFWEALDKPILVLAPMDGVTDTVFRQIVCRAGKPEAVFTEFINVDELEKGSKKLIFADEERPIVVQIWGTDPEKFYKAAQKLTNFDGIDINFGCPQRKIIKAGGGAAMICQMSDLPAGRQVLEILKATKEGSRGLPVSVKTRIGFDKIITEDWIGFLLEQKLAAITVHGRRAVDREADPANWEEIGKAVRLRGKKKTLIIGNGDVRSLKEAKEKAEKYGVDGVMIGRAVWNNPWFFSGKIVSERDKLKMYLQHIQIFEETYGSNYFFELRKFAKTYVSGFSGAGEIRNKVMKSGNLEEMKQVIEKAEGFGV